MPAEEKFSVFKTKKTGARGLLENWKISFALFSFAFWTIFAVFAVIHGYAQFNLAGRPVPWDFILVTRLSDWYFWVLMTPVILWLGHRFPLRRNNLRRNLLLIHAPFGLLTALAHILSIALLMSYWSPDNLTFTHMLGKVSYFYPFSLLVFSGILAVFFVFDYNRKYRERELQAANLKTELAQARLRTLQMQLQPHFLFNTLNSISTLTFKDPQAANLMLVKLSDLLRVSLIDSEINEVPLEKELEFLRIYLEIEQIRFQDRLMINFEIEPQVLNAFVPRLILQPLVENAVRHGISKRRGKGFIEIASKKVNENLFLQVRDNGLGLSGNGENGFIEGVGLWNTRRRLSALYGENFHFQLTGAEEGGVEAKIIIPFKTEQYAENTDIDS